jgi:hypothetical protein
MREWGLGIFQPSHSLTAQNLTYLRCSKCFTGYFSTCNGKTAQKLKKLQDFRDKLNNWQPTYLVPNPELTYILVNMQAKVTSNSF